MEIHRPRNMLTKVDVLLNYMATKTKETMFTFGGYEFHARPHVFYVPSFQSGRGREMIVNKIPVPEGENISFMEVGSGTGCSSVLFYKLHEASISNILATEINEAALANTRDNFLLHNVPCAEVRYSDVFGNVAPQEKFDIIYWNVPYVFVDESKEISTTDRAIMDPGYKAIMKYISKVSFHLKPSGRAFLGFSKSLGRIDILTEYAKKHGRKLVTFWTYISSSMTGKTDVMLVEIKD